MASICLAASNGVISRKADKNATESPPSWHPKHFHLPFGKKHMLAVFSVCNGQRVHRWAPRCWRVRPARCATSCAGIAWQASNTMLIVWPAKIMVHVSHVDQIFYAHPNGWNRASRHERTQSIARNGAIRVTLFYFINRPINCPHFLHTSSSKLL